MRLRHPWLLLVTLVSLVLTSLSTPAQAALPIQVYEQVVADGDPSAASDSLPLQAKYTGPLGIEIRSYSTQWTQPADLQAVYDELLQNLHGSEIGTLGVVNLYPGGNGGLYHAQYATDGVHWWIMGGREIDLFMADELSLKELARVLSHEYGHHFTMSYRWTEEHYSFKEWQQGAWADVRGLRGISSVNPESAEHGWLPWEIAAEDYVQFFGSPLARSSTNFTAYTEYFSNDMYNLIPQENLNLPLASERPDYKDYWLNLAGLSLPPNDPASRPWLQVLGETSNLGVRSLNLQWTGAVDPERGPLEYTIVSYTDPLGLPIGHLTTSQTNVTIPIRVRGAQTFRIFVKDQAGLVVSSNPVALNLDQQVLASAPPLPDRVWMQPPAAIPAAPFGDVYQDQWYASAVNLVTATHLVNGYPGGGFQPAGTITRAEFLTILLRAYPVSGPLGQPFADVPTSHWAYTSIHQARAQGLVKGDPANLFHPDDPISRAEMAVMLARVLSVQKPEQTPHFTDVTSNYDWARDAIETLAAYGLIKGLPSSGQPIYGPGAQSLRSEAAAMLSRLYR